MNGQWKEVAVAPPHSEGFSWGGLLVVYAYDVESGSFAPNHFEVLHEVSGEFMLEVNASLERTQDIATDLANIADWAAMSTTDEMMLQARLMAFGAGYPGEVAVYNEWAAGSDFDRIVPYGAAMTTTQSAWSHQRQGRGEAPGKSARPRPHARRGAGSVEFV